MNYKGVYPLAKVWMELRTNAFIVNDFPPHLGNGMLSRQPFLFRKFSCSLIRPQTNTSAWLIFLLDPPVGSLLKIAFQYPLSGQTSQSHHYLFYLLQWPSSDTSDILRTGSGLHFSHLDIHCISARLLEIRHWGQQSARRRNSAKNRVNVLLLVA